VIGFWVAVFALGLCAVALYYCLVTLPRRKVSVAREHAVWLAAEKAEALQAEQHAALVQSMSDEQFAWLVEHDWTPLYARPTTADDQVNWVTTAIWAPDKAPVVLQGSPDAYLFTNAVLA